MSQQHLDFGSSGAPIGGIGSAEKLNDAFQKIEDNFGELYSATVSGISPGIPGRVTVGGVFDTLAEGDSSSNARDTNSSKVADAFTYAINNGIKEVILGPSDAWYNPELGMGVGGADQKSLHLKGSGGGAFEDQTTNLRFPDVTTVALEVGNGQFMQVSDLTIVGNASPSSRKALTGTGIGFNHNTHQIRCDNVRVLGFNTCYKSGYNGDVLCDSVALYSCSAIGYIGWHVSQTQNYINALFNPTFSCTIGVKSDVAKAVNIYGGNLSVSDGKRKAFTISGVSGLSSGTDSTQIPDNPFTNATFTATVTASNDDKTHLTSGAYDAFAIDTTAFGPIPLRMTDWDADTNTITLTFDAYWLLGSSFEVNFAGGFGTILAAALSGATTLYACETITVFQGLNANIDGIHVENAGSLTCLYDMFSGFGGDDAARINRPTFNYSLDQLNYHGGSADDEAVFMCQQAFPFIWMRGYGSNSKAVLKLSGIGSANSTNRVLISSIGRGVHRLIGEGIDLKPNLRTLKATGGDTSVTDVEVIQRGFGEWDDSPFAPDADPLWSYSRRKLNGVPFTGYFPAEHADLTIRGSDFADIDDGLGSVGTYPPLVGLRPYRINAYDVFDASDSVSTLRWVESSHGPGWSYGQDLTIDWSFVGGTNVVRLSDTSRMFAGLRIYFDEDGQSATDRYIVTGVYPTLGYITVVLHRTGTGLGDLAGTAGTTYTGSTVKQEPFSFSRLGLVPD